METQAEPVEYLDNFIPLLFSSVNHVLEVAIMKYKITRRVEVQYTPSDSSRLEARQTVLHTVHLVRGITEKKGEQNNEKNST